MKGNRYVREIPGFPEPFCDYCRVFVVDLKQHYHERPKLPKGTETVTDNERLLEIIRASI